ncbi:MAG: isoleucine--tRNA ligase [Chitinophagaceae bacterium]|nr:isoleucine--tRNA ligase [Bacteroidota bacterium]MCC6257462.1 isoleucine--tRNA ligase [Chitinophagaceae bacterium]MCW5916598.1 isoleucine--tRNA ligase [Ferruginibacter sp.]
MQKKYTEYQSLNLPSIGEDILKKWDSGDAFAKSISLREGSPHFVFYEGPPSANGMPGIHHVISRTLKDLVCRYKTMKGFKVTRKGGWDTHGLPIELGVEKELGITKEDIGKSISVEDYNKKCREAVMRFKDKWDEITRKMGYWVDLEHPYITFTNNYIESLWWCLSQLYNRGYLYESVSIQPYSPAAGTGLSSHELNQPGTYKDVKDTSAVVMFKAIKNTLSAPLFKAAGEEDVFFMAWTTTPWTLPSNLGLTVGPQIEYTLVKTFNPYSFKEINVVLATPLLNKYFKAEAQDLSFQEYKPGDKIIPWKRLGTFKGSHFEGIEYEQLLPFDSNNLHQIEEISPGAKPFRIILGDFVTTEDGTGIVHTAPAFGADDFKVGHKNNLGILTLVDKQGKFIAGTGEFSGRYVKNYKDDPAYQDVNVDISVKLKKENRAFKIEKYEHSYPHCWRTDKPIIYYPLDAWFIRTTAAKDQMVELNKNINWKPASTGSGRFGNWLENMVDWNLSRSRFWGTPLPIWRSETGQEEICIGSMEELNREMRKAAEVLGGNINQSFIAEGIKDLHKPFVDEIILVSPSGNPMKRVPDLIDVWFDSGAMPYAQWHFPFENKERFSQNFPADFIAEGVDQTRGWFYTLHALASLLKDAIEEELKSAGLWENSAMKKAGKVSGVAYKTVVSNGLVLDKAGNKMSKRIGNVVDPFETIANFGPDATRWYLITNASPWDSLKFDMEGIKESQRKFFGTLYNTYQFFALYANVDGFTFNENYIPLKERPEIDQWILSSLNSLVNTVTANLDDYEPTQAGRAIEEFVDSQLSNWYVRLCRRRFWKGEYEQDKICAYQTLYECLETLSLLIAPIAPFFADWLFLNLNEITERKPSTSVHHNDFPISDSTAINSQLETRMQIAQDASSLILSLRKKVNIKVRQPLQKVFIPALNRGMADNIRLVEDIIKAETNIKQIDVLDANNDFIRKKAKANYKTLGKKLGPKMKAVAQAIEQFQNVEIEAVLRGNHRLNTDGEDIIINPEDIEVVTDQIPGFEIAGKGGITVALDISISEELQQEGDAREFVNRVQNIRKESNFQLTDKIVVRVKANENLQSSLIQFKDYICREILADSLEFVPLLNDGSQIEVNDSPLTVNILKKTD